MKVVFLGSGSFAVPSLERLHAVSDVHPLVRVISRPDQVAGRGNRLKPTPVRARARELGLPCDLPRTTADPEYLKELRALGASLFVVADYGEILSPELCAMPSIGTFNLHGSLLPKFRGASPVQYAILEGEKQSGVTLFRVERTLDSGPIVDRAVVDILPHESAGELEARLAVLAADLLQRNLEAFASGTFTEVVQDHELATRAPKIRKAAALIDWTMDAERVAGLIRAYNPSPRAFSFLHQAGRAPERTVFTRARAAGECDAGGDARPGAIEVVTKKAFRVVCGRGALAVERLQRPGKAEMDTGAYMQGKRLHVGDFFGPLSTEP